MHPDFVAGNYDTGFLDRHSEILLGYPVVPEQQQTAVAVAVAIAAARMERATGAKEAVTGEAGSRLAPWVAQHRARFLR